MVNEGEGEVNPVSVERARNAGAGTGVGLSAGCWALGAEFRGLGLRALGGT